MILVAYFSASGETARLAKTIAQATGADLYEIRPAQPYTAADLNWHDNQSRSSVEMKNPACRPAIAGGAPDLTAYDTVFVGFPIWWYQATRIIETFLASCDFSGKRVVPFGHLRRQWTGAHGRDPAKILSDKSRLSVRQTV